jgi:hypothetical protein
MLIMEMSLTQINKAKLLFTKQSTAIKNLLKANAITTTSTTKK